MDRPPKGNVTIGWYDGMTEGFIEEPAGRWVYASMIAWAPEQKFRIFGLVPADAVTVLDVRVLCAAASGRETTDQSWQVIRARISEFLQTVEGEAELRLCYQVDGDIKDSRRVDARLILGELGREIEEISSSTRFASWMSRFNA
ncbi:MAG: hypothetical protein AB1Z98_25875 [Nannocystaceae bacterium]